MLLVVFIIIQGPKGEGMINSMNGALCPALACVARVAHARCSESRMFGNFTQTKNFVTVGTWGLAAAFLVLSAVVALKTH